MAKKISNESFIEKDFGQPAIDVLKELIELNKKLADQLKETGKEASKSLEGLNPSESVKDAQKLTKELEKLTKAKEELNKIDANDIKLTRELQKVEAEKLKQDKAALDLAIKENKVKQEEQKTLIAERKLVQQNQKIKVANRKERERQFKNREKERKQRSKQLTEYQKESRRLNELRNRYKDLAVAEKENTAEAKELLKEITKLDKKLKDLDKTVGQNQRNVGDYGKALEGLNDSIGKLGIAVAITKGIELLGEAFGNTREGALELQILFSKFTETAKVLVQNLINSGEGIKDFFSAFRTIDFGDVFDIIEVKAEILTKRIDKFLIESLGSFSSFFFNVQNEIEKGALKLQISLKKVDRAASVKPSTIKKLDDEISNLETTLAGLETPKETPVERAIKKIDDEIKTLEESIQDVTKPFDEAIDKIGKAFEGTVDTTKEAIKGQREFLELQLKTRISIEQQEKALAGLAEQRQILQDLSDDDTLSFIERVKIVQQAQEAALEFAKLEEKLALDREKLTIQAVKQDLRRANALSETRLEQITTGEQLRKELENEAIARKVSDANDEAFTAAFLERVNKQVEAQSFRRDQEEKNRKTARDAFEQELDILEEFTEKRVAANEQIISSDSATLEERQKALLENERLEKELFEETTRRILEQGKASIDLRKDLTEAEKEERKELLNTQAIQEILNTQDEKEILNLIRKLQLGEIEEKRLKDSIKIKQDIAKINEKGAKAEDEAARKTIELQDDILIQEKKLKDETFDLQKAQFDNQKKDLEDRIKLLKKDSIQRLELEKQLNDLLLEEQARSNEESAKKRADAIRAASELATNIIEEQNEKRLQIIDDTLNAVQERQDSLRAAAEQGNEEAVKSLAESEKQEAQIRAEKERELKRQQRIEAGLAAFQAFAANAEEDPNTALSKTLTDITALTAFISSLPSFFVGTEDTGKANNALDQNGGRLAVLHDNERVMTAEQNKAIGKMSNEELTRLAVENRRGTFRQFEQIAPQQQNILVQQENESIKKELKEIVKAVKANKTDTVESFNNKTNVLTQVVKQGNKVIRTHKKIYIPLKRD